MFSINCFGETWEVTIFEVSGYLFYDIKRFLSFRVALFQIPKCRGDL